MERASHPSSVSLPRAGTRTACASKGNQGYVLRLLSGHLSSHAAFTAASPSATETKSYTWATRGPNMCFWPVDMFPFSPLCLENIGTFQYQGGCLKIPRFLASLKNILRSGRTGSAFPRGGSSLWGRVRTAVQMRQAPQFPAISSSPQQAPIRRVFVYSRETFL